MNKIIVGIAGCKGAGKDTVANLLKTEFQVGIDRLAYPIKWVAENMLEDYPTDNRERKEVKSLYRIQTKIIGKDVQELLDVDASFMGPLTDSIVSELCKRGGAVGEMVLDYEEDEVPVMYTSPRIIEQSFGAAARDVLGPDIFVEAIERRVAEQPYKVVVVPDIRMDNEAHMCDFVIEVEAPWVSYDKSEATESGLDKRLIDLTVLNEPGKLDSTREQVVDFFYTHVVPKADLGYE